MLPNDPWFEIYIYNIFNLNAHNVPYVPIGVLQYIQRLQSSTSWCPLLPKNKNKNSYPTQWANAASVSNMAFQQPYYCLLLFCHSLSTFSSLVLFRCIFVLDQP
jgi:hypothetical protein